MENQLSGPTDSSMNIIVSYYQFSISAPYQPGPHTLTVGEASALNALRADPEKVIEQTFKYTFNAKLALSRAKTNVRERSVAQGLAELGLDDL